MHGLGTCVFWLAVCFTLYTYALYPLLLAAWARLMPSPVQRAAGFQPTLSIVVAAYNEAARLAGRVENLLAQDYPQEKFEIILADDGSSDGSPRVLEELARRHGGRVKTIALDENRGKAAALNAAVEQAAGDVIVFADARQRFEPDVLARLAENFGDWEVGAVSGELMFTAGDLDQAAAGNSNAFGAGVAEQVGLYWKYEKWMRRNEAVVDSMLGATGAIYAIRRVLYQPLPPGTLLDDFLTPMRIVLRGRRAVFDGRARAWDHPSEKAGQEFRRKVRTLAGNYQAFAFEPGLLKPWVNQTTWLQVWSHKLFRLWVPFALALMLVSSAALAAGHPLGFYSLILIAQLAFYAAAWWGWQCEKKGAPQPHKIVSLAYTFTVLNLAAAAGLRAWLKGRDHRGVWQKTGADAKP